MRARTMATTNAAAALMALWAMPASARAVTQLQQADALVQTIGWKLAHGNARYCARTAPAIGLQLQDIANYDDPALARRVLGLSADIAVEAVADGSPAQAAGLDANDAVLMLAGRDLSALPAVKPGDWQRLQGQHDAIDAAMLRDGKVTLTVRRDGTTRTVSIPGEPACAARFELDTDHGGARATAVRVIVSKKMVDEVRGDEEPVAAVLAHEFAHAALDHQGELKRAGRGTRQVRRTEQEADRLSVWLLANAGYPPEAAARFMRTWGPRHDLWIFAVPGHGRWTQRARMMDAEVSALHAAQARDPAHAANWQRDFVRAPLP
ncbi:M48 family metallopeptidase [Novosphingobium lentum]|uniref:M48 family metallopeptidase n=1 Tax=Novosphingobium lentum TaxID=145287 RepID=UPI0008318402|nr:M48 family metallopeptidase [Novosphingobium lentum]